MTLDSASVTANDDAGSADGVRGDYLVLHETSLLEEASTARCVQVGRSSRPLFMLSHHGRHGRRRSSPNRHELLLASLFILLLALNTVDTAASVCKFVIVWTPWKTMQGAFFSSRADADLDFDELEASPFFARLYDSSGTVLRQTGAATREREALADAWLRHHLRWKMSSADETRDDDENPDAEGRMDKGADAISSDEPGLHEKVSLELALGAYPPAPPPGPPLHPLQTPPSAPSPLSEPARPPLPPLRPAPSAPPPFPQRPYFHSFWRHKSEETSIQPEFAVILSLVACLVVVTLFLSIAKYLKRFTLGRSARPSAVRADSRTAWRTDIRVRTITRASTRASTHTSSHASSHTSILSSTRTSMITSTRTGTRTATRTATPMSASTPARAAASADAGEPSTRFAFCRANRIAVRWHLSARPLNGADAPSDSPIAGAPRIVVRI